MMPGFVQIDRQRFYLDIWPRIKHRVEAIESNWKAVHAALKDGEPPPDLLIHWGYRIKETDEKAVLAIVHASQEHERYWIKQGKDVE